MRGHETVCTVIVSPYGWYIYFIYIFLHFVRERSLFFYGRILRTRIIIVFPLPISPPPSPHVPTILFVFVRSLWIYYRTPAAAVAAVAPNDKTTTIIMLKYIFYFFLDYWINLIIIIWQRRACAPRSCRYWQLNYGSGVCIMPKLRGFRNDKRNANNNIIIIGLNENFSEIF